CRAHGPAWVDRPRGRPYRGTACRLPCAAAPSLPGGGRPKSTRFEATVDIDRPIDEVFAYLADGEHDPEFSPRVQRIDKEPGGPTHVGTVFTSTVKDAGMTRSEERRVGKERRARRARDLRRKQQTTTHQKQSIQV